jgi:hypothetical protein
MILYIPRHISAAYADIIPGGSAVFNGYCWYKGLLIPDKRRAALPRPLWKKEMKNDCILFIP